MHKYIVYMCIVYSVSFGTQLLSQNFLLKFLKNINKKTYEVRHVPGSTSFVPNIDIQHPNI